MPVLEKIIIISNTGCRQKIVDKLYNQKSGKIKESIFNLQKNSGGLGKKVHCGSKIKTLRLWVSKCREKNSKNFDKNQKSQNPQKTPGI